MRRVFHRERAERSRAELQRSEPPCGKPVGAAMLLKLCVLQPPKKRALGAGGIFGPEQVFRFRRGGPTDFTVLAPGSGLSHAPDTAFIECRLIERVPG